MKTSTTFKSITLIALLGAALAAPALAQGGMGMGGGMGGGPGMQNGGNGNWGQGMGFGGHGGRGMRFNQNFNQNTARGWTLMTPEERTAFQVKMRAVKTYDECKVTQTDFRNVMETRAKEKSINLMTPRQNPCDNLKARGLIS